MGRRCSFGFLFGVPYQWSVCGFLGLVCVVSGRRAAQLFGQAQNVFPAFAFVFDAVDVTANEWDAPSSGKTVVLGLRLSFCHQSRVKLRPSVAQLDGEA